VAVPTDGTEVMTYSDKPSTPRIFALQIATYLGWVLFEIGQQTQNLDVQARTVPPARMHAWVAPMHGTRRLPVTGRRGVCTPGGVMTSPL
jgi:hypothetical protein